MEPVANSSNISYETNYRAIAKAVVPATLLSALTVGAFCAIGRSLNKSVTPFSGNIKANLVFSALTVGYFALFGYWASPFRKPKEPPTEEENQLALIPNQNQKPTLTEKQLNAEKVIFEQRGFTLELTKVEIAQILLKYQPRLLTDKKNEKIDQKKKINKTLPVRKRRLRLPLKSNNKELSPEINPELIKSIFLGNSNELKIKNEEPKPPIDLTNSWIILDSMLPLDQLIPAVSQKSMPGTFNAEVHGPSGIHMKYMEYYTLLKEYACLFKEAYGNSAEDILKDSNLSLEIRSALELLTGKELKSNLQEQYISFCQAHRKLIGSNQDKGIAQALAWARFMVNIQTYQNEYVKEHIGEREPLTAQNFHEELVKRNKAVNNSDSYMKIGYAELQGIKHLGDKSLCNYFEANPPNLRNQEIWTKGEETRTIYHLRHATPNAYHKLNEEYTYGEFALDNTASINPLYSSDYFTIIDPAYTAFLEYAKSKNEGAIYACHQKITDTHEGKRCKKIIALEETHPNLLLLFQSVEFPLFMKGAATFKELKDQLIASFDKGDWNRLPKKLQNDTAYKKEMKGIFTFVHQTFFEEKRGVDQTRHQFYPDLDQKYDTTQAQACIMLFYHYQREHLKFYDKIPNYPYQVTYVNSGCKDNFDRGFNNNCSTDRIHQTGLFGNNVPQEQLEATANGGMAVTLHGKGIGILGYRLHPTLLISKLLTEISQDKQQQILRAENGWKLTRCGLPLQKDQFAVPQKPNNQ